MAAASTGERFRRSVAARFARRPLAYCHRHYGPGPADAFCLFVDIHDLYTILFRPFPRPAFEAQQLFNSQRSDDAAFVHIDAHAPPLDFVRRDARNGLGR